MVTAAAPLSEAGKPPPIIFTEIGRSGLKRYSGQVHEEFLPHLRGRRGVRVFQEMRDNDAVIGAAMCAIEQVIRRVIWFVEPESDDNLDREAANFVHESMHDMSHTWNDFIAECLSFLSFGWSWFEEVYKVRQGPNQNGRLNSKFNDGMISWQKLALRSQDSFHEWEFDKDGGIRALVQMPAPDFQQIRIPIEKSLLFRTKTTANNPEGRSLFRNAYRAWFIKKSLEELEAIGIERDLIGIAIVQPPEGFNIDDPKNTPLVERIGQLLFSLRRDEQDGIFLPPGWTIDVLGGTRATRRQFDVDKVINRWDKRIAAVLLAQFIMLGMDRVGSFALSKNQNDLFMLATEGYLDSISSVINRFAIPRLMRVNPRFASISRPPRIVPGKVSAPELESISIFLERLGKTGFITPTEEIETILRRQAGLSSPQSQRSEVLGEDDDDSDMDDLDTRLAFAGKSRPDSNGDGNNQPANNNDVNAPASASASASASTPARE